MRSEAMERPWEIRWGSARDWAAKAWGKAASGVQSTLADLRPGMSLASGAVLVLLTLFIPIAYDTCGGTKTGMEFIRKGADRFPPLGFGDLFFARQFYTFTVFLATSTLILVAMSRLWRPLLGGRGWVTSLFAVAGTVSFWQLGGAISQGLGSGAWVLLNVVLKDNDTMSAVAAGLLILAVAYCLRSKLLRGSKPVFAVLMGTAFVSAYAVTPLFPWTKSASPSDDQLVFLAFLPYNAFWLVPAYLWYRFGLSRRPSEQTPWPKIRSNILKWYLPGLIFIPWMFWDERRVWGIIPYTIGIHLMSLGYMRLAHLTRTREVNESASASISPA